MGLSLTKSESFKTASRSANEHWRHWQTRCRSWLRAEYQEAQLSYIRFRAEKGDAARQYRLGLIYENGEYGLRSDEQAYRWFLRAGFQGLAEAQAKVSEYLRAGRSVPRNDEEAFVWCRKAAEQGHVTSQLRLAQMYQDGTGVERNPYDAKKWFARAERENGTPKA